VLLRTPYNKAAWGTDLVRIATNTVHHDAVHPSYIELPVDSSQTKP
jgi:hypothetical protein